MITRRLFLTGTAAIALLIRFGGSEAFASAPLTILYISASDCSNCRGWEQSKRPDFLRSSEGQRVPIREISRVSRQAAANSDWPDDLKWVLAATTVSQATPRFILIQGNKVVTMAWGASGFEQIIVPSIRTALAQ
jgi:hypothetical protein